MYFINFIVKKGRKRFGKKNRNLTLRLRMTCEFNQMKIRRSSRCIYLKVSIIKFRVMKV